MRSVDQWLEDYGDSHRHPINKALHWVCVPLIVLTVLGLLSLVPLPRLSAQWPWLNAGSLAATLAVLYYLDLKYPAPPIFGRNAEEAAVIVRVIEEFQAYTEQHIMGICRSLLADEIFPEGGPPLGAEALTDAMHVVAREARTIEQRLARSDWIVGEDYSACDMIIFPMIQLLRRALLQPRGADLARRFLPVEVHYPALGRWLDRIESQSGYVQTYPPHWRLG